MGIKVIKNKDGYGLSKYCNLSYPNLDGDITYCYTNKIGYQVIKDIVWDYTPFNTGDYPQYHDNIWYVDKIKEILKANQIGFDDNKGFSEYVSDGVSLAVDDMIESSEEY